MWKKIILGIVAFIILVVVLALVFTSSITSVADKQLTALRHGDMVAAYALTSKDFRNSTSLAEFEKFVNTYPSLKNNQKASWSAREINNGQGTLKGKLVAMDGGVTPIEYHFVKENEEWKIIGISLHQSGATTITSQSEATSSTVNPPATSAPVSSTNPKDLAKGQIYRVLVSDQQSASGSVATSKGIISISAPKVFVTTYILKARKGLKVSAEMVYVRSGSKIGPSVAVITKSGNIIRDFSFTNTQPTWPVGDYAINISTSNNQHATVNFKMQ